MPSNSAQSSNLLDLLQVTLTTEREAGDLTKLDPVTIAAALDRIAALDNQIQLGNHLGLDEFYSLKEHLSTIVSIRTRKICGWLGYARPTNMLPNEATFYDTVAAATIALRDAWGLTE